MRPLRESMREYVGLLALASEQLQYEETLKLRAEHAPTELLETYWDIFQPRKTRSRNGSSISYAFSAA